MLLKVNTKIALVMEKTSFCSKRTCYDMNKDEVLSSVHFFYSDKCVCLENTVEIKHIKTIMNIFS